jgi:hypothetical protein
MQGLRDSRLGTLTNSDGSVKRGQAFRLSSLASDTQSVKAKEAQMTRGIDINVPHDFMEMGFQEEAPKIYFKT